MKKSHYYSFLFVLAALLFVVGIWLFFLLQPIASEQNGVVFEVKQLYTLGLLLFTSIRNIVRNLKRANTSLQQMLLPFLFGSSLSQGLAFTIAPLPLSPVGHLSNYARRCKLQKDCIILQVN
jgi:hypothetical protein